MLFRFLMSFTAIAIATNWTFCAHAASLTLVEGGKPAVTVIVEAEPDDVVRQAVDDLCHYVKERSAVDLPVVADGNRVEGPAIYVGKCEPTEPALLPPTDTNPETYAIHVSEGNLFLAGNHPPATAFAVLSFIEEDLGVRWFAPGELWEYVPAKTPGELTLDVENRVVTPDWSCRVWSGHAWVKSWKDWGLRNKAVWILPVPFRNMQNYLHKVFAPEKYAESHPEYYPLIDGKRWIPPEDYRNWRPCVSNPEVVQITVEAAREFLDAHPEHNSFSLAMDDIYRLCGCENCRAMDASPDDYEKKQFSDRHYKFVNDVARELAKTHPDKYIGTLCYHIARELPETVPELEPNVFISMTQRVGEWWRPGRREADMTLTKAWRARCDHMSRYGYIGLGFLTPRVFPHAMAEAMKYDHALGFEAVYNECYTILPNVAPMMWMIAKLQWDTERDADALLDEFYGRMFGSAADTMKAYYGVLEDSYMEARPERLELASWGHRSLRTHSLSVSLQDLEKAEAMLQQAATESDDADVLKRIDIVSGALEFGSYIIRAGAWARALGDAPIENREQALASLERVDRLIALSKERERFWAAALERDDILGEALRGQRDRGYFVIDQMDSVERPAALAMETAFEVLEEVAPEEAMAQLERIATSDDGTFGGQAKLWLVSSRDDLENVLRNPGFEEGGANETPAAEDWDSEGAPPGWSRWDNGSREKVRFFRVSKDGRNGSQAIGVENADSACYLQSVPVEPGQRYVCVAYVKTETEEAEEEAGLGVRWRTASGQWHERRDLEAEVIATISGGRWHRLTLVTSVPEGAAQLVFMLKARSLEEGNAVLFDDAVLSPLASEAEKTG